MAHIDVSPEAYRIQDGEPEGEPCDCWERNRGYGAVYFADATRKAAGRRVAEIVVRAINEAIRLGQLPPEEP